MRHDHVYPPGIHDHVLSLNDVPKYSIGKYIHYTSLMYQNKWHSHTTYVRTKEMWRGVPSKYTCPHAQLLTYIQVKGTIGIKYVL